MTVERAVRLVAAAAIGVAAIRADADDIEVFVGSNEHAETGPPNVLLIVDDSMGMTTEVPARAAFDPATSYPGDCDPGRVYWTTDATVPQCSESPSIALADLVCRRALDAFEAPRGGTYHGVFAQYDPRAERWGPLAGGAAPVECADDVSDPDVGWVGHGDGTGPGPADWGSWPTAQRYSLFTGNYLNWQAGEPAPGTRMQIVKDAAANLVNSINGVSIGVMHFNDEDGGELAHAVERVETARPGLIAAIDALSPTGSRPLTESLFEAYRYFAGQPPRHGADGDPNAFDGANRYASPIELACQKHHVVLLSSGGPRHDDSADAEITSLVDASGRTFGELVGASCDTDASSSGGVAGGRCLDDLAEFMHKGDLSPLDGTQNVTTHTIGFGADLPLLAETARRGGGLYRTATDAASFGSALASIMTGVVGTGSAFVPPTIGFGAYGQIRHETDLYVGLFRPTLNAHWPGNLKKFRLRSADSTIVGAGGRPVLDAATGTLSATARDLWSAPTDGGEVTAGGAANRIPSARNVYTWLGPADLTHRSNRVATANAALTDASLRTGKPGRPSRREVIEFINGIDVADHDGDGDTAEPRHQLGDPLHSRPVVVDYGPDEALVFFGTNDGMLHAVGADDGVEVWAFVPPEFLGRQTELLVDEPTASKHYGVDGPISVQTIGDEDGIVEPADGERLLLFFGMRRGGDMYYGLDVTDPESPQLIWRHDGTTLPGAGQSWSAATPARIDIDGSAQNPMQLVLVIGGGYDPSQDSLESNTDAAGNAIFIIDMLSGALLWHGAGSGGHRQFAHPAWRMDYSIPGDIRVLDLDADGFADRMYAADTGGQIWRFDIMNGRPASELVTGGVFAQLGAAGLSSPPVTEQRRFFYAPDVALVVEPDRRFVHIGIGSGHRARPNSSATRDEFYSLRDYGAFVPLPQTAHDARPPITRDELVDITHQTAAQIPPSGPGWRLGLGDTGEKVLAEARTFANRLFVSTYEPAADGTRCAPAPGTIRQYVVALDNGAPVDHLDASTGEPEDDDAADPRDLTTEDRYREFSGAPPPETTFLFPDLRTDTNGDGAIDGDDDLMLACAGNTGCLDETICQGLRCFSNGVARHPIRTFWLQRGGH